MKLYHHVAPQKAKHSRRPNTWPKTLDNCLNGKYLCLGTSSGKKDTKAEAKHFLRYNMTRESNNNNLDLFYE